MAEAPPEYREQPDQTKVVPQEFQTYRDPSHDVGQPPVTFQPMGIQSPPHTTVIVNQSMMAPNVGPRLWSSGVCGCFDEMSSCCLGFFCPCILACKVASDMDESCCVPVCVVGALVAMRTKIRTENKIQGSIMDDCCTACCCGPCAVCQMSRELTFIRNNPLQPTTTGTSTYVQQQRI